MCNIAMGARGSVSSIWLNLVFVCATMLGQYYIYQISGNAVASDEDESHCSEGIVYLLHNRIAPLHCTTRTGHVHNGNGCRWARR